MGEINVVPYIDVMLVLLIIFMITAPLLTQGVKVDLPKADAAPLDADFLREHEPLVLTVNAAGQFYLNIGSPKDKPVDARTVIARAAAVIRRDSQTPVLVRADERVPYGRVVSAMVLLQKAGAEKVGFLTDPAESLKAARQ
jgi:biopolymer transport protein TolR